MKIKVERDPSLIEIRKATDEGISEGSPYQLALVQERSPAI